jgi:hypothetical protein
MWGKGLGDSTVHGSSDDMGREDTSLSNHRINVMRLWKEGIEAFNQGLVSHKKMDQAINYSV